MKSTKIYTTFLALAAPMLLAACSSSADEPAPAPDGDFEGIVLNIPAGHGTRAEVDPTDDEAKISQLYVVAFKKGDDGSYGTATLAASYTNLNETLPTVSNYKQLNVLLKEGTYHIYVYANFEIESIEGKSEEYLKGYGLGTNNSNYQTIQPSSSLTSTSRSFYIPMSCPNSQLKLSKSGNAIGDAGEVIISKGKATQVFADLTFLYAKVRLTILNPYTEGPQFKESLPVIFGGSAKKIGVMQSLTALDSRTEVGDVPIFTMLTKYKCPTLGENEKWETWSKDDDLTEVETDANAKTWAYQGTFYVPERLLYTQITNPSLKFNWTESSYAKQKMFDRPFLRGNYYDIVCYVEQKVVYLGIRAKKWQYHHTVVELENEDNPVYN